MRMPKKRQFGISVTMQHWERNSSHVRNSLILATKIVALHIFYVSRGRKKERKKLNVPLRFFEKLTPFHLVEVVQWNYFGSIFFLFFKTACRICVGFLVKPWTNHQELAPWGMTIITLLESMFRIVLNPIPIISTYQPDTDTFFTNINRVYCTSCHDSGGRYRYHSDAVWRMGRMRLFLLQWPTTGRCIHGHAPGNCHNCCGGVVGGAMWVGKVFVLLAQLLLHLVQKHNILNLTHTPTHMRN